ncbi:MAG: hypothetical protein IKW95_02525 [Lachnospiraceae bacterium]|nr:hypothetical protein [Lachnospiraceae bacterium]
MKEGRKLSGVVAGLTVFLMVSVLGLAALQHGGRTAAASDGGLIPINDTTFPDANFRSVIATRDYDRDGDGFLSPEEISLTINIHCDGKGIKSVKGIEYFTALQGLYCTFNEIESWDLSHNKDLRGVWCSNNKFTKLDFSANPELVWVYCYECKLTTLNVSNNPKMAYIECNTNPLTELNVSNNRELEHLMCGTCGLTSLNVSNNPKLAHLDAFRNNLTSLDVSNNPLLKRLDIWDNHGLGNVDVSKNKGLQYYNCANNGVTSIDVTNNPELQKLICSYNSISALNVSCNPKLFYLDCACNRIGSLNLKNNPKLHFLQAFTNPFTTLDISGNPLLVKTYKEGTKKAEYSVCQGHSWTLNYGGASSTGGDNLYFLCFDDIVTLTTGSAEATPSPTPKPTGNVTNTADLVKREAVMQKLYEMAGSPSVAGLTTRFKDVKQGSSYYNAVVWGQQYAIAVGTPDISSDCFGVGQYITRQDLMLMLMRYSEAVGYKRAIDFGRSDDFLDYYDVDDYAWEAVCWAATWNIMEGKGEDGAPKEKRKIDPHGKATKTEMQTMINRMLEVNGYAKPKIVSNPNTPTTKPAGNTPTPKQNNPSPTPKQGGNSPTPKQNNLSPTPKQGGNSPTPKQNNLSPTPEPNKVTPGQNTVTPGQNNTTPGQEDNTPTPDANEPDELTPTPDGDAQNPEELTPTPGEDTGELTPTPGQGNTELTVTLEETNPRGDGKEDAELSSQVIGADTPKASPTPTVSAEEMKSVTSAAENADPKKGTNKPLYIGLGIAAGVILLTALWKLVLSKKKAE